MHRRVPLALLLSGLALSGCGSDNSMFPPDCPEASILTDAGKLTRYDERGRDLTDLVLKASISGLQGACSRKDEGRALKSHVQVAMIVTRGPAAQGRVADLPYFVAVARGPQILDKNVYVQHVVFPPNVDTVSVTGQRVDMVLPTEHGVKGSTYHIWVGFQLTPDEMRQNQAGPAP